jgi:hypothetical protein
MRVPIGRNQQLFSSLTCWWHRTRESGSAIGVRSPVFVGLAGYYQRTGTYSWTIGSTNPRPQCGASGNDHPLWRGSVEAV